MKPGQHLEAGRTRPAWRPMTSIRRNAGGRARAWGRMMTLNRGNAGGRAPAWCLGALLWVLAGCGGGTGDSGEAPATGQGDAAGGAGGTGAEGVIVLRADRVLDGRGGSMSGREVVVRDGRIEAVAEAGSTTGAAAVYDLSGATLLPGLIDTHVHLGWHFDRETGRLHTAESTDGPEDQALYAAENAWKMLRSGVTTVQSVGGPEDVPVRDAIAGGTLPGPRVLTSIRSINAGTGGPDEMRAHVDEMAAAGADVVKIFASESIRVGGGPTLSQEQLDAACGRATEHGLRTVVHAHGPESARRAALAGCSQIEHGALLDRATLELLAERGLYYDPHIHLIFDNYFANQEVIGHRQLHGVGSGDARGRSDGAGHLPGGVGVEGLRTGSGTDAWAARTETTAELPTASRRVARTHGGRRVGDQPCGGVARLDGSLGALEAGYEADIIAVAGDPSADIGALGRVVFVMRAGSVYRNDPVTGAGRD